MDNFNGIELLGRTIRVDHKHKYSLPVEVSYDARCENYKYMFAFLALLDETTREVCIHVKQYVTAVRR